MCEQKILKYVVFIEPNGNLLFTTLFDRDLQQEIQQLQQQQKDVQHQMQELQSSIRQNEQHKKRAQTQRLKLQDSINQLVYVSNLLSVVVLVRM